VSVQFWTALGEIEELQSRESSDRGRDDQYNAIAGEPLYEPIQEAGPH
jgi:hypothetical protein